MLVPYIYFFIQSVGSQSHAISIFFLIIVPSSLYWFFEIFMHHFFRLENASFKLNIRMISLPLEGKL